MNTNNAPTSTPVERLVMPDDNDFITEQWLCSVLQCDAETGNWQLWTGGEFTIEIELSRGEFVLWLVSDELVPASVRSVKTRGDVRQICAALGVELQA